LKEGAAFGYQNVTIFREENDGFDGRYSKRRGKGKGKAVNISKRKGERVREGFNVEIESRGRKRSAAVGARKEKATL